MSKKLLSFLLAELGTVRVKCVNCKKVAEMSVFEVGVQFTSTACPFCRRPFTHPAADNPFVKLSEAVTEMQKLSTVEVEFVTEDKS